LRRSSSFSTSKYRVVTSYRHNETSPAVAGWPKHAAATWSRYPPTPARFNERNIVRSDACSTPSSSSTRSESVLLVGSTIRAKTSCSNAASSTASNPSRAYTVSSTCHNSGPLARDHSRPLAHRHPLHLEIQGLLTRPQPATGLGHQDGELGFRPRRPHMLQNHVAPSPSLRNLDLRAARPARDLPHKHHEHGPYPVARCLDRLPATPLTSTNINRPVQSRSSGTSQVKAPGSTWTQASRHTGGSDRGDRTVSAEKEKTSPLSLSNRSRSGYWVEGAAAYRAPKCRRPAAVFHTMASPSKTRYAGGREASTGARWGNSGGSGSCRSPTTANRRYR
jgi:hypothetical protein